MSAADYEPVIGIEAHVELATMSKMFCGCANDPSGLGPNEATCPTCLGLPGALPAINRQAIMLGIRASLALHSEIADICRFERKNYLYPDLVKGYQISQYELPIGSGGFVTICEENDGERRVPIRRVHLEEDTAKLLHREVAKGESESVLDCNRSGVPLLEVVTEPAIHSVEHAELFLRQLRNILIHNGVSRCRMERGEMRLEVNVSLRPVGSSELANRVEIKNQSSFRFVRDALNYEIDRQAQLLGRGQVIKQVTCGWNPELGKTFEQRGKEDAHDYRYFPEPDLPPVRIESAWIEQERQEAPEPLERSRDMLIAEGVSPQDVRAMIGNETLGFLLAVRSLYPTGVELAARWLAREIFALMNEAKVNIQQSGLSAEEFVRVIRMLDEERINARAAAAMIRQLFHQGGSAEEVLAVEGFGQISDLGEITRLVGEAVDQRADLVEQYRSGKTKVRQALFGAVMRKTKGRANPRVVRKILDEQLRS